MSVEPEDFPGGENGGVCKQFKNIFETPKLVPPRGATGLKWGRGHLKAKTAYGGKGHFRIFAELPRRDTAENKDLVFVFSQPGFD